MKIRWILLTGFVVYGSYILYSGWDIEHGPREDGGYDLAGLLDRNGSVNIHELYGDDVTEIQFFGIDANLPISPEICDHDNNYFQSVAIILGDSCQVYEFKSRLYVSPDFTSWSAAVGPNTMVNVGTDIFVSISNEEDS